MLRTVRWALKGAAPNAKCRQHWEGDRGKYKHITECSISMTCPRHRPRGRPHTPNSHLNRGAPVAHHDDSQLQQEISKTCKFFQKGRKGAGVKGAGVTNCRIFRSAVPSVVVWSILLVSLSGVKKKLWQFMTRAPLPPAPFADSWKFFQKFPLKKLAFTFGKRAFTFGERAFTFGERAFTFGERTFAFGDSLGFRVFWNFFFGCWGVLRLRGSGVPRRGFRKYLTHVGPRFVVDVSFFCHRKGPNSQKRGSLLLGARLRGRTATTF